MAYDGPSRPGRPRSSSHADLAAAALRLFRANGFAHTSVREIAANAGIGRSTFFNYFATKDEVIWSCHAHQLGELEKRLAEAPDGVNPFETVARALVEVTADVGPDEATATADYQAVIAGSPELRAVARDWSTRRADVIAGFIARRLGARQDDLVPLSYALALNGAVSAAAIAFAGSHDRRLSEIIAEAIAPVYRGFADDHRVGG
jgi:AcrR family transcriptional regulator